MARFVSGEGRGLGRGFRESLREDVQLRDDDRLRAEGSIRLELDHDARGVVAGLDRLDLVQVHELLARLAVARELEGLLLVRRGRLHVALAEGDLGIQGVQGLRPRLEDRIVPIADAVRRLPLRVVLPVPQDRGRVDEHRLSVAELDDRDLLVRRPQLRVPDRLEVRRGDQARATLVEGIDDRAGWAALAVAVRTTLPAVAAPDGRRV